MFPSDHSPLPNEDTLTLYKRLLAGDPTASVDLTNVFLDRLADWLIKHNPQADADLCETAAEDAILGLIKNPVTYKPERQTLEVYLRISALGDLKNLLRSEKRHSKRRADWENVEHSSEMGKYMRDESTNPEFTLEHRQEEVTAQALIPIMEDKTLLAVMEVIKNGQMKMVEIMGQMHERMEANDLALAKMITENNQALAKILQQVIDVTTRTERMTSEILMRVASPPRQGH